MSLFLTVPWVGLLCAIDLKAFPGHTHLIIEDKTTRSSVEHLLI